MKITLDIPAALAREIELWARQKDVSVSTLQAEALEHYLQILKREEAFKELENLIGTPVAPDFDTQLADLRCDDFSDW